MNAKIQSNNAIRAKAAKIKNWYLVNGQWCNLTQAEARKAATLAIAAGGVFRKATIDEELDLDGI